MISSKLAQQERARQTRVGASPDGSAVWQASQVPPTHPRRTRAMPLRHLWASIPLVIADYMATVPYIIRRKGRPMKFSVNDHEHDDLEMFLGIRSYRAKLIGTEPLVKGGDTIGRIGIQFRDVYSAASWAHTYDVEGANFTSLFPVVRDFDSPVMVTLQFEGLRAIDNDIHRYDDLNAKER